MKPMEQNNPVHRTIASVFGLFGGVSSYLTIHLGFDVSFWGTFLDRVISVTGALLVAFLSGAAGYLGSIAVKRLVARFAKNKRIDS